MGEDKAEAGKVFVEDNVDLIAQEEVQAIEILPNNPHRLNRLGKVGNRKDINFRTSKKFRIKKRVELWRN